MINYTLRVLNLLYEDVRWVETVFNLYREGSDIMKFTGRPPKFMDAEELEKKIAEYFEDCDENDKPYTVTGLAYTLGITVKQLRDYKNAVDNINILKQLDNSVKAELSNIVKRAYQMCEMYAEKRLLDSKCNKSPVGYIFALKNFQGDFVDKTEVEQTNNSIEVKLED